MRNLWHINVLNEWHISVNINSKFLLAPFGFNTIFIDIIWIGFLVQNECRVGSSDREKKGFDAGTGQT